jgi:hypothetical protein
MVVGDDGGLLDMIFEGRPGQTAASSGLGWVVAKDWQGWTAARGGLG